MVVTILRNVAARGHKDFLEEALKTQMWLTSKNLKGINPLTVYEWSGRSEREARAIVAKKDLARSFTMSDSAMKSKAKTEVVKEVAFFLNDQSAMPASARSLQEEARSVQQQVELPYNPSGDKWQNLDRYVSSGVLCTHVVSPILLIMAPVLADV